MQKKRLLTVVMIFLVAASINLFAQRPSQKIDISLKNSTLKEFINFIESKTNYTFMYKNLDLTTPVTIEAKQTELRTILSRVLTPLKIAYEISGERIILTQIVNKPVTGTVIDALTNEPIAGATISEKGTTNGTATDADGKFSLTVGENAILQISFIGYKTLEINVLDGASPLSITLIEDTQALEEIVVVGYGTQKKVNLTGAVEVIEGKKLQDRPAVNVSQAMQGTVSGVTFNYGSFGFEPGANLSIQIRGQGSPYVLIDGTVGDINLIDPNDIENISVLKDAAASAIYGARAPYGVVLITTKSGKRNEKIQVDFSTNLSFTNTIRKPHDVDSYTFVRAMNEIHDNQGEARLFSEETIDRIIAYINDPSLPETVPDPTNPKGWATYLVANGNNDWFDIHFGSGWRTQENLSLKGGAKNVSFFVSVGHSYEEGIFNFGTDNYRRINFNSKLDFDITEWWKFTSNTRVVQSKRVQPNYDSEGDYAMALQQIYRTQPQQYLKSPNGYYAQLSRIPMVESGTDETTGREMLQRFATQITPLKNWIINADYSIDVPYNSFVSENFTMYQDYVDGTLFPISTTVPSYITKYKAHTLYNSLNVYSSYDLDIQHHHIGLMAGYQQEESMFDNLWGQKKEMITSVVPSFATSTGEMQTTDQLSHWATQGIFARLNYDYEGKYLLEANMRYDGTSKFAKGHQWGTFPSVSIGWNISRESFWKPISPVINSLKLKGSWGSLGNQNVDAYQDLPLISVGTNLGWILNGSRPAYTIAPNLINPNLTWESSETTNGGFEMGLLDNRLQITGDYYQRLTFNRLGPAKALPAVLGASIPSENNSELRTRGWDFSLTWRDRVNKDFSYSISAMMFDYLNVVTKYNNPTGILTTDYVGKTVGEIWGYETIGLIRTQEEADEINSSKSQNFFSAQIWRTGDVHYRDLNGDGVVNNGKNTVDDHGDLKVIGNSTSRYQYGLSLNAEYKNFDFSAFLQGTAKRDLWISGTTFWGVNAWNWTVFTPQTIDYYRDTEGSKYSGLGINTDAYLPRPYSQNSQYNKNKQVQTRYLQNGAYARLKNIQLGYKIPQGILNKIGLQSAKIYFSGENIWTWSPLPPTIDPEIANLGSGSVFALAVYSMGLNVSF
jgi:TonB-linked SusC/RagA family outer membrane protein